ncbi:hypothetical protein J3Q64DRAFT_1260987 [Phycomyces blakesleeanus]|uniref:RING-type E3 ubiquitin transferase n=2 Tax=Phycomyces blakesleeanus TaxID=4837 RepID=A0A162ZDE6_PHYB8|nr:hypothetical protein PHYBLDRAFT_152838 [Phycomyces blakesleeanus NRRL 1555(-)]OAD66031.1 hypothetical protein PHYBLDRAFT_152838 [Phycomyces blakesleeanus NRRL 1555(-)]|eukprot:XP_018284071.1 hypothetical protein PHYBLDRAFT_152838 [Phycomyces blakesleeanus NRRL 1555(-)]
MRLILLISFLTVAKASISVLNSNTTCADHSAAFGPPIQDEGLIGFLMEPSHDPFGCTPTTQPTTDWVALLQRGGCSFITKVRAMQISGAVAVVVGDPESSTWITMYAPGDTSDIKIPSVFVSKREYRALVYLTQRVNPLLVRLEWDGFISWPMLDVLLLVVLSPSIMMLFVYCTWKIRRFQKQKQDLAPAHIVSGLTLRVFSKRKTLENEPEDCSICLEDYALGDALRVLPCHHDFHASCVDAWLTTRKKFCPICKRDVTGANTDEATPLLMEASPLV